MRNPTTQSATPNQFFTLARNSRMTAVVMSAATATRTPLNALTTTGLIPKLQQHGCDQQNRQNGRGDHAQHGR